MSSKQSRVSVCSKLAWPTQVTLNTCWIFMAQQQYIVYKTSASHEHRIELSSISI